MSKQRKMAKIVFSWIDCMQFFIGGLQKVEMQEEMISKGFHRYLLFV
jgi:hypothetical protein